MPNIPYPNVPSYPGVPQLVRPVESAIASVPVLATSIGIFSNLLAQASQQAVIWGIFDEDGNQIGIAPGSNAKIVDILKGQITGAGNGNVAESTTVAFDFSKATRVSDFPIEGGSFASFNKVQLPIMQVLTITLSGDQEDRGYFLRALEEACNSTDLFNIVTPEDTYIGYTIESYRLSRTAERGATLLLVEVTVKQIRQVFALVTVSKISFPQDASATPQTDNGKVQAAPPDTSTLKSLVNKLGSLLNGGK